MVVERMIMMYDGLLFRMWPEIPRIGDELYHTRPGFGLQPHGCIFVWWLGRRAPEVPGWRGGPPLHPAGESQTNVEGYEA
jgi:hypothetical protein